MRTLLHISASPRGEASESLALASEFLDELGARRPDLTVETWDLWDGTLPEFGPAAAQAKMAVFAGEEPAGAAAVAWADAKAAFERFAAAEHYLFTVPMWNHSVPYILKQLIDVVSQPGMVFGFDAERGYTGLLTGRTATVVFTSAVYAGGLAPAFGRDFQQSYFDDWLRWAGFEDVVGVAFRQNLIGADVAGERAVAGESLRKAAARL